MSEDTSMTTPLTNPSSTTNVDPAIFASLQSKIDEESIIRDELKAIVDTLSKQGRLVQSILSRMYNTPTNELQDSVLVPCNEALSEQTGTVKRLSETASQYPYYKWNSIWQRDIQNVISSMQLCDWLSSGKLITLEEVGLRLNGKEYNKDRI